MEETDKNAEQKRRLPQKGKCQGLLEYIKDNGNTIIPQSYGQGSIPGNQAVGYISNLLVMCLVLQEGCRQTGILFISNEKRNRCI